MRVAVDEARLDLECGLALLPAQRREQWAIWISQADSVAPMLFSPNGFTVTAFQAAWAAITLTDTGAPGHLERGLRAVVHAGDDTDTVAVIAGQLLGARYGASAVPAPWRQLVHG